MMDLGATVCAPRAPRCLGCALSVHCRAHAAGTADAFPVKPDNRTRPERRGTAFWIERAGHVLLVTRAPRGLLGGMGALPTTDWVDKDGCGLYETVPGHWQVASNAV